MTVTG